MNSSINKGFGWFVKNKKNKAFWVLFLILATGFFLRAYHFGDWLHFELDQSRDAKVVGLALEQGIGNLPLLGPKAAGSFLRLGPLFYYMEYLSGLIFGNNPVGIALLSLILSCGSIALFYFFVKRYFSEKISLMATALFSVSLFMIMYSRFAWNPNNLPFFTILFLYALLRLVDETEKKKGVWLMVASLAFSFVSQLHFVALVSLPVVAVGFLVIKRPKIALRYWIFSILILIFFYIPPIVNDFKTGGENIAEFEKVFLKKSTKGNDKHNIIEKAIKDVRETSLGYFMIATGYQQADLPDFRSSGVAGADLVCNAKCKKSLPLGILALVAFFFGIILHLKKFLSVKEKPKRDFLLLTGIWFLITTGIFVPIAYDLAPRFFLLIAPMVFVFWGFVFEILEKGKWKFVGWVLFAILALSNLVAVWERFSEMSKASSESFVIDSDKILKERDRVTLAQQLKITDYIKVFYRQNGFPVYLNSEAFYRRAFLYHLEQRNILRDDFRNSGKNVYAQGNYFLIYPTSDSLREDADEYLDRYEIAEIKNFGTLSVLRLVPKPEAINIERQIFGPDKKPTSASGVPVRCRWDEVFGECNTDGTESPDEAAIE
jgi:membrane protein implicated in regulation of membrane protease activity